MKLGTAVLLLSKITDQRTALQFFFDLVHVSEDVSASRRSRELSCSDCHPGNVLARWIDRAHLRLQHHNSSTSVSSDVKGVGGCEMNPPDHSDMSQRVASSVAPEVTAVGSAYQENPAVSDLIDFMIPILKRYPLPHPTPSY